MLCHHCIYYGCPWSLSLPLDWTLICTQASPAQISIPPRINRDREKRKKEVSFQQKAMIWFGSLGGWGVLWAWWYPPVLSQCFWVHSQARADHWQLLTDCIWLQWYDSGSERSWVDGSCPFGCVWCGNQVNMGHWVSCAAPSRALAALTDPRAAARSWTAGLSGAGQVHSRFLLCSSRWDVARTLSAHSARQGGLEKPWEQVKLLSQI